jgi:group I intron endonuclease
MIVYKIVDKTNGKTYVGQTTTSIEDRWSGHKCKLLKKGHKTPLYAAMLSHGLDNFSIQQIDTASSLIELNQKEQQWIATLGSVYPEGYNLMSGGSNGGKHNDTTKAKISASLEGTIITNHWNTGRKQPCSEEHKAKISASMTGIPQTWKYKKVVCVETGIEYESVNAAAEATGIARTTISAVVKSGMPHKKNGGCHFELVKIKNKDVLPFIPLPTLTSRPIVYFLVGTFGCGKTWIANQLKDKYEVYSKDKQGVEASVKAMLNDHSKIYLYESPVHISSFIKRNKHQLDIRTVVVQESLGVIKSRLEGRIFNTLPEDRIPKIEKKIHRMKVIANKTDKYLVCFSGTSQSCLDYLSSI